MPNTKTRAGAVLLAACTAVAGSAHAAANVDFRAWLDWDTASITGPVTGPAQLSVPAALVAAQGIPPVISGVSFGWVGSGGSDLDEAEAYNGSSAVATHSDASRTLAGGFDAAVPGGFGEVMLSNTGPGVLEGYAGGGFFGIFTATANGTVTASVEYAVMGYVSTEGHYEYANAGFEWFAEADDMTTWLDTFNATYTGSNLEAASAAADAAGDFAEDSAGNWNFIECYGPGCTNATGAHDGGIASLSFDVIAGRTYWVGAEISASGYTDVSVVPVPAAAWLFGSALLGLARITRRRRA